MPSSLCSIPAASAIACAVSAWSPVISLSFTPARWHCATASGTAGLRGSRNPSRPNRRNPRSSDARTPGESAALHIAFRHREHAHSSPRHLDVRPLGDDPNPPAQICNARLLPRARPSPRFAGRLRVTACSAPDMRHVFADRVERVVVYQAPSRVKRIDVDPMFRAIAQESFSPSCRRLGARMRARPPRAARPPKYPAPSGTCASSTNSPAVSVPVLSRQMTVVEPSVSTLANRRTKTPCRLRRYAPTTQEHRQHQHEFFADRGHRETDRIQKRLSRRRTVENAQDEQQSRNGNRHADHPSHHPRRLGFKWCRTWADFCHQSR